MRFRPLRVAFLLVLTAIVTGCSLFQGNAPSPLPVTPTPLFLVTAGMDATPTLTPFQPLSDDAAAGQPGPNTTPAGTPTPTTDPNAAVSTEAAPVSFYVPPYAPAPVPVLTDNQMVTFALLGADKRPGETYFRTDTIVLAAIRPATGQVTLISVPRDLYVYVPSVGMDRINAAYEYGIMYNYPGGGAALFKDTILYNLGMRIDHIAIVDFNVFTRIVDTLGGLDVPVYCPYTDWHLINPSYDQEDENNWALFTVGPGVVHMDGNLALWYARSRKKSSDFDRGRRSQEVLRALYAQALRTDAISKIPQLYNEFNSSVITDLNLDGILKLAPLALHLNNADIRSYYVGREDVTGWMTPGGASVLLPNGPAIQALLQQALSPNSREPDRDALTVEIRNGTGNEGWDALAAQRLNYAGYNTRLSPADRPDYGNSFLYDLGATPQANRDASMLAILGLPNTALISAPTDTDVNYVLIVGQDYKPCFDPTNMAP